MQKPLTLSVLLSTLLLAGACQKNEPTASLPAATESGANTGGYLVGGQPFVATGIPGSKGLLSSTKPTPPIDGGFLNDSTLCLGLNSVQDGRRIYLTLFVRYHGVGTYRFNQTTPRYGGGPVNTLLNHAFLYQDYGPGENAADIKQYCTDALHTGSITLTKANPTGGILAGQFEFSAFDNQSKQLITVTQGRFDYLP